VVPARLCIGIAVAAPGTVVFDARLVAGLGTLLEARFGPLLEALPAIPTLMLAIAPGLRGRDAAEAEGAGEDGTDDG
jgi:hypothetical protein